MCRSCRAPVDWAAKFPEERDDKGRPKTMPVNPDAVPNGNLEVWRQPVIPTTTTAPATVLYYRYLRKGEQPAPGRERRVSHFATCPDARQWRTRPG